MRNWLCALALAVLAMPGCSRGRLNSTGGGGGGTTTSLGELYVATNSGIVRFNNALAATGNITPAATITGATTTLSAPQHLLVDPTGDRLFVANAGASSVLIFENASTLSGNVAPTRTVSGSATLLSAPHDLAIDPVNNLLYVADGTQILVFQSASTITGNIPPVHNIGMGFAVGAILLDVTNNRLYVADTSGNAIDRLEGASLQNGAAVVAASIAGPNTGVSHPAGLALDSGGRLIVANAAGPSLTIFGSAATATGNVTPAASVSGSGTQLAGPDQIVLNPTNANGELYVADKLAGAILIFGNVNSITGATPPQRTITGTSTTLVANGVSGVALDPAR
jgi:DNA-binding beta-propeller fold protein YncE